MAHLIRRAGFGAQYDELGARAAKGYDATVEELLHPEDHSHGMDLDMAERYFVAWSHFTRSVPEYIAFLRWLSPSWLNREHRFLMQDVVEA